MTQEIIANRYAVLRLLGEGAMGRVWLVRDAVDGDEVALKAIALRDALPGESTIPAAAFATAGNDVAGDKSVMQFKQEFRLMTALRHPNCCRVYDFGETAEGDPFFTMEVVPGRGVDEMLPLDSDQAREVLSQLLLALGYVHQLGFVHLDIKPANVRVRPDGVVKLMDFGLMDYAGRPVGVRGTLAYMSPEMLRRAPVDQRSDLYAVGCLAYEMLTGRPPFLPGRMGPLEVLRAHASERPEPPSRRKPGIDPDLERIVLRMLAKEPEERYQSAAEALRDLGREPPAELGGKLLLPPVVGQDVPRDALKAALDDLVERRSGATLHVSGPAGSGKTRLIEGFRFRVQVDGVPYARASLAEPARSPYAPFTSLMRALLPALQASAPEALAMHAPVLVKLLPELDVPPAPEMETPRAEMLRLHAAITTLIGELARQRPQVLVLSNWQWADGRSRELLADVVRRSEGLPVLLIVVSRETEPPVPTMTTVPLAPLTRDDVAQMVGAMLGTPDVSPRFIDQLAQLASGNPLFVERLLSHLVRARVVAEEDGRWLTDVDLAAVELPTDLAALAVAGMTDIAPAARRIARFVALAGQGIDLPLLGRISGLDEAELFEALEALETGGILARDGEGAYLLAREAYQEALLSQLAPDDARKMHAALALGLAARLPKGGIQAAPMEAVVAVAHHALAGELQERAASDALEAARRHLALFSLERAEAFLTAGFPFLADDDPLRGDFLSALGEVKRHAGDTAKAVPLFEEAQGYLAQRGDRRALGRLLTTLAKCKQIACDYDEAMALCERSERISLEAGDQAGAARCMLTAARVRFFQGDSADARVRAAGALAVAEQSGDKVTIGHAEAFLGYMTVVAGGEGLHAGIDHLDKARAQLEAVGDIPGLNNAYNLLGNARTVLGDLRGAGEAFEASRRVTADAGLKGDECVALVSLATTAIELGDFRAGLARARQARKHSEQVGSKLPLGMAIAAEALAAAHLGQVALASAEAPAALRLARAIKNRYLESLAALYATQTDLLLGRTAEARATGEALAEMICESGNRELESRLTSLLAEVAVREGRLSEAQSMAERAGQLAREARVPMDEARAALVQAQAAIAARAPEEAERHAAAALAIATRVGNRSVEAQAHGILGEAALARGVAGAAAQHFEEMAILADVTAQPAAIAVAAFGRAAAAPYQPEAAGFVAAARAALEAVVAPLDAEASAAWLAPVERQRAWEGNHHAFSLPLARAKAERPVGPPGFMGGMGPL